MAYNLLLPPNAEGEREEFTTGCNRIIIIGANGSGKTRFTDRLIADTSPESFRMSALNAIYNTTTTDPLPGSIDTLYQQAIKNSAFLRNDNYTQIERLIALMVNEEMMNLLDHKLAMAEIENHNASLPVSKLDILARAWLEAFPNNRILRESGRILFSNHQDGESYSQLRLSDGEKAVLYYLGAVQYAPKNGVIFVDSPDMFLHPSTTTAIWDRLESMRPDCMWIYTTHNIEFLASKGNSSRVIWVRGYDAARQTWDYAVMPPDGGF
ncbi:ATP-binding protein, partial [Muribaculum caecicola]